MGGFSPIGAAIGAGTSILGGILGSQAAAAAARLQVQGTTNAANFAKQTLANQQAAIQQGLAQQQGLLQPYQQAGGQALTNLSNLLSTPGQGLLTPWTQQFQAPTAEQAAATPGYQFQVQQAQEALQNSAAARGGLLTGGTAKALDAYTQGLASTNYQQTYNNMFQNYLQNYQQFQQNQANQYNRLSGMVGVGQWGAGGGVNAIGQATGQNIGAQAAAGQQVGGYYQNIGAEQAAGKVGAANAWMSALGGAGNAAQQYGLLSSLNQSSPSAAVGDLGGYNVGNVVAPGLIPGAAAQPSMPAFNASGYSPSGPSMPALPMTSAGYNLPMPSLNQTPYNPYGQYVSGGGF